MNILFIVESPGKISKISSFLNNKYIVKASVGIIRDLDPKNMSIDFSNNFEPIYINTKPDVIKNLKNAMKGIDEIYIATDMDREGEGIAQSLYEILKPKKYKRLLFNSITKESILSAIQNGHKINKNLVDAQKARRILDRLFGYLISPILQKKIGGNLSAGRVQSVTTKIIIDKENEIINFFDNDSNTSYYKVNGTFLKLKFNLFEQSKINKKKEYVGKESKIAILNTDEPDKKILYFLNKCLDSIFVIHSISNKTLIRSPPPPFTTSTLQQDANHKYGMSVDNTMKYAQKLYEAGYITYMRTDSVEISDEGHKKIKNVIINKYGKEYYHKNIYKNTSANSQEAHEAIRPTNPDLMTIKNENNNELENKLYKLIWKRTIASQMAPAKINATIIQVSISKFIEKSPCYYFQGQDEFIIFPGFMKIYNENNDDNINKVIPKTNFNNLKIGTILIPDNIIGSQEYLTPPGRYTEASLVKKLEKLGIGRPSTFSNIIKTIKNRNYIKTGNVDGIKKDIKIYKLQTQNGKLINKIFSETSTQNIGKENKKLLPTNLGISVNKYLLEYFTDFLDYNFTAKMEKKLDAISNGKIEWYNVIKNFYSKLEPILNNIKNDIEHNNMEKLLGKDNDGYIFYAVHTKYGPSIKKVLKSETIYKKIENYKNLDDITLSDAIKIFEYPKYIGLYNKANIDLCKGRYGFYITHNNNKYTLDKKIIPDEIDLEYAIKIIKKKKSKIISEFNIRKNFKVTVLDGKYGSYINVKTAKKSTNYKIPKNINPKTMDRNIIMKIITPKKSSGSKNKKNQ